MEIKVFAAFYYFCVNILTVYLIVYAKPNWTMVFAVFIVSLLTMLYLYLIISPNTKGREEHNGISKGHLIFLIIYSVLSVYLLQILPIHDNADYISLVGCTYYFYNINKFKMTLAYVSGIVIGLTNALFLLLFETALSFNLDVLKKVKAILSVVELILSLIDDLISLFSFTNSFSSTYQSFSIYYVISIFLFCASIGTLLSLIFNKKPKIKMS